jgi:hypothetical protein
MNNICLAMDPLSINHPNGNVMGSMHIYGIVIPGLPMILTGHIFPGLSMASLMGIRVLCKAGHKVIFTNSRYEVKYQNKVILHSTKNPATKI